MRHDICSTGSDAMTTLSFSVGLMASSLTFQCSTHNRPIESPPGLRPKSLNWCFTGITVSYSSGVPRINDCQKNCQKEVVGSAERLCRVNADSSGFLRKPEYVEIANGASPTSGAISKSVSAFNGFGFHHRLPQGD